MLYENDLTKIGLLKPGEKSTLFNRRLELVFLIFEPNPKWSAHAENTDLTNWLGFLQNRLIMTHAIHQSIWMKYKQG